MILVIIIVKGTVIPAEVSDRGRLLLVIIVMAIEITMVLLMDEILHHLGALN